MEFKTKYALIKQDIIKNYKEEITEEKIRTEINKRILVPIFIDKDEYEIGKRIEEELESIITENLFLKNRVLLDILEVKEIIRDTFQEHSVTNVHLKFLNPVFWDLDKRFDKWHSNKIKEITAYCTELLKEEN